MKQFGIFNIYLLVVVPSNIFVDGSDYNAATTVFKDLFSNYTKEIRPILNQSLPLQVSVSFMLRSINDYDEVTGALSMILVLTEQWTDEKFKWDPTEYNYQSEMIIPQKLIWKPELYLINPADNIAPIGNDAFKVRLSYDGSALWFTGGDIKTSCSPDMTYFPFDIQTCALLMAPWGYMATEVSLNVPFPVDLSNHSKNGAWTLKKATTKVYDMITVSEEAKVSMVEIIFELERKPLYYILSLIFPILSLCFLNPMVFILPYDSGERVSFCITVLLSFAVFMTMTGEIIPKVSEPMPLISIYLFIVQTLSGAITTINGLIFRAYSHDDDDPVPPLLWKIVLLSIKVFGCSCCCKSSVHPQNNLTRSKENIQLEDYQESDNKGEENTSRSQKLKTSWLTVAKTMDRVFFILSYSVFVILSSIFIFHTVMSRFM